MMNCLPQQVGLTVIHPNFNDDLLATSDRVDSDISKLQWRIAGRNRVMGVLTVIHPNFND